MAMDKKKQTHRPQLHDSWILNSHANRDFRNQHSTGINRPSPSQTRITNLKRKDGDVKCFYQQSVLSASEYCAFSWVS